MKTPHIQKRPLSCSTHTALAREFVLNKAKKSFHPFTSYPLDFARAEVQFNFKFSQLLHSNLCNLATLELSTVAIHRLPSMENRRGNEEPNLNHRSPIPDDVESDMSGDESDDEGILVIQPDEISAHNALKRLVDKMFVSRDTFRVCSVVYDEMQEGEVGVSRHLRNMLFPVSRQIQRRGKRRDRIAASEGIEAPPVGNKHVQRQSKQKERCENKLMSLLFATVYDHSTKRCRLAGEVPPLKLIKVDKKGQQRNVSNYTEVRAYLRHAMAVILSSHSNSTRVLLEMIPSLFGNLPCTFMIIARTFMVLFSCENTKGDTEGQGSANANIDWRKRASASLETCIEYIQEYLDEWGNRTYTRKKKLKNCREAGRNDVCYEAIFRLLRSMIVLYPPSPTFPFASEERKRHLYRYSLAHGGNCSLPREKCLLGSFCLSQSSAEDSDIDECHEFADALFFCAETATKLPPEMSDSELQHPDFPTAVWKAILTNIDLHRFKEMSFRLRRRQKVAPALLSFIRSEYASMARHCVKECWAALARSITNSISIIQSLGSLRISVMRETVVELVFGGGIAAMALFENEDEIRLISEKLRGRKGNALLGSSTLDNFDLDIEPSGNRCEKIGNETAIPNDDIHMESERRETEERVGSHYSDVEERSQSPQGLSDHSDARDDDAGLGDGNDLGQRRLVVVREPAISTKIGMGKKSVGGAAKLKKRKTIKNVSSNRQESETHDKSGSRNFEDYSDDPDANEFRSKRCKKGRKTPVATPRRTVHEYEASESEYEPEEEETRQGAKQKASSYSPKKKKRRGTITRTIQEANIEPNSRPRLRKKGRKV